VNLLTGPIRKRLFGLPSSAVSYTRRVFRGATPTMRERIEQIGTVFIQGYHIALEHAEPGAATSALNQLESETRGFAFEGAAMGFALMDAISPRKSTLLPQFLIGGGAAHAYMLHVGAGWMWARIPWGMKRLRPQLDPLLQWLAFDGWGFHEGFFHWEKYMPGRPPPSRLAGYERNAFDQGLGRCWWFVNGGNPELVAGTIAEFPIVRRGELWSGVGLAATYAGFASEAALEYLRQLSNEFWPCLAQGAAFAAKARHRAGNSTAYTELAARKLTGLSASEAAQLTDSTLENLPAYGQLTAYEIWRRRIQAHFRSTTEERGVHAASTYEHLLH